MRTAAAGASRLAALGWRAERGFDRALEVSCNTFFYRIGDGISQGAVGTVTRSEEQHV